MFRFIFGDLVDPKENPDEIRMVKVNSSHLRGVGYDYILNGLVIDFHTRDYDNVYFYTGVPESVYDALLAAPSKGKFFWDNIRFQYDYWVYQ